MSKLIAPPNNVVAVAPRDWLRRRYRLPPATAKLIAEMIFPAGVAATEGGVHAPRH